MGEDDRLEAAGGLPARGDVAETRDVHAGHGEQRQAGADERHRQRAEQRPADDAAAGAAVTCRSTGGPTVAISATVGPPVLRDGPLAARRRTSDNSPCRATSLRSTPMKHALPPSALV